MTESEHGYDSFEDEADDDTLSEDPRYTEVVVQFNRVYQRYSLEEDIYHVPIDPVGGSSLFSVM